MLIILFWTNNRIMYLIGTLGQYMPVFDLVDISTHSGSLHRPTLDLYIDPLWISTLTHSGSIHRLTLDRHVNWLSAVNVSVCIDIHRHIDWVSTATRPTPRPTLDRVSVVISTECRSTLSKYVGQCMTYTSPDTSTDLSTEGPCKIHDPNNPSLPHRWIRWACFPVPWYSTICKPRGGGILFIMLCSNEHNIITFSASACAVQWLL